MLLDRTAVRDWLKARRVTNDLHLEVMALRYDLDGAVAAGQVGLAWWSQEELLRAGVQVHLRQVGVDFTPLPGEDRNDRSFRAASALERVDPELGDRAWRLWLRPMPAPDRLAAGIAETMAFLRDDLGLLWVSSRADAVRQWADDTRSLRAVARAFGVARSDDWYLASDEAGAEGLDWYDDLLRRLAEDERTA